METCDKQFLSLHPASWYHQSLIYQQTHFISVLENIKIHIKTYIKIAPTCFGLLTIIRELTYEPS